MPQRILGIDLGSWSVKAVLVETSFRSFDVVAVREVRLPAGEEIPPLPPPETPGQGGPAQAAQAQAQATQAQQEIEREAKRERQIEALIELLSDGTLRSDAQVIGFPGEQATTRFITLPFNDPKRVEQTIPGALADSLPFELEEAIFDHHIIRKLDDGGSISLAAVAMKEDVSNFLAAVQGGGIDPKFLPVDVLQLFNLYSHFLREDLSKAEAPAQVSTEAGTAVLPTPGGPPDARLMLDIGHERTLVCAASQDGIAYVRVLRAGGKDVTEAIAKAYGIAWNDAEEGKHADALVTSARHPAPSDAAQRMAEVVSEGLQPLVKELRRTLQAIRSEKRVRVARVDLLGGGAKIRNLANYLAEQLNVPVANGVAVEQAVERQIEAPRRPAYAAALAYSLRGSGDEKVSKIDLRVGDLQFAGQLRHLRERVPVLAGAAGILIALLGVNTWAQYHTINARESAIDEQFCVITEKTLGKRVCEPTVALSMMKQPSSELGSFKLPERSAFRVAADVSNLVPQGSDISINEMEVTSDRLRISGEASSFDAVDQIVTEYEKDDCLQEIKKGKLRKKSDGKGVEFQISAKLRCS